MAKARHSNHHAHTNGSAVPGQELLGRSVSVPSRQIGEVVAEYDNEMRRKLKSVSIDAHASDAMSLEQDIGRIGRKKGWTL